ncbi:MAG: hypothetical protein QM648_00440 [Solirubrobacterales bacterium]
MPEPTNTQPGALQMSDQELVAEAARSRMVTFASVLTVTLFTAYFMLTTLVVRNGEGSGTSRLLETVHEHKAPFIIAGMAFSLGILLTGTLLAHLALSAQQRSSVVPKFLVGLAFGGPAFYAIVYPIFIVALVTAAKNFAGAEIQNAKAATDAINSGWIGVIVAIEPFARVFVVAAWVMTSMQAMRVGLLTRLVGFVGVAIGALFFFSSGLSAFVAIFWIGAVAITLLGDGRNVPPAWKLGRPVPWSEVAQIAAQQSAGEDASQFDKSEQ